ncbi:MAG: hypothetical protein JRF64_10520, partial [Deltaproteobacteria bacterium]|nr:hypothetical protein [Deltaproteobacteria bacterium]
MRSSRACKWFSEVYMVNPGSGSKREGMKMIRDILFWAVTSCCCAFTLTVEAKEVPPIPKGYADEQAVMTAIVLGQIKLIDAKSVSTPDNVEEILGIEYGTGGESRLQLD